MNSHGELFRRPQGKGEDSTEERGVWRPCRPWHVGRTPQRKARRAAPRPRPSARPGEPAALAPRVDRGSDGRSTLQVELPGAGTLTPLPRGSLESA